MASYWRDKMQKIINIGPKMHEKRQFLYCNF
jgi:hypothetical protein